MGEGAAEAGEFRYKARSRSKAKIKSKDQKQRSKAKIKSKDQNFACAKKSNQKKAHPGLRARSAKRSGFVPPAGFFYRTSLSCRKTRTSMCVTLTGLSAASTATALWGPKSIRATTKTTATATATALHFNSKKPFSRVFVRGFLRKSIQYARPQGALNGCKFTAQCVRLLLAGADIGDNIPQHRVGTQKLSIDIEFVCRK